MSKSGPKSEKKAKAETSTKIKPKAKAGSKAKTETLRRIHVRVTGVVQGVGFRPFVYSRAKKLGLAGYVLNDSQGVQIELEGLNGSVNRFLAELEVSPPRLAVIAKVSTEAIEPKGEKTFTIRSSVEQEERTTLISPDYATCKDCLSEMNDPDNRRHRYPFINCTNCGPRYTIIRDIPYDRARTTMSTFEMCAECRSEYEDPSDRRFHAEPTCCRLCGPRVYLTDQTGAPIEASDPIAECIEMLTEGKIVAVKGLGGFHLACDAADDETVSRLRARKAREEKPLAVMVRDLAAAGALVYLNDAARKAITSPARPIVLMRKRKTHGLSELVAPKSADLGVMLPYTPLHHLLMQGPYAALVMTSGNITDEPIAHTNNGALGRLSYIADAFLLHDRDIHIRTDDSVVRCAVDAPRFIRRSRGYAPFPVELPPGASADVILAVGPELKNTICVTRDGSAFVSHHVGDLRNAPAYAAFLQAIDHLSNVLEVMPGAVACDMHPAYLSTKYARDSGLPAVEVQHHHAHIASVLAEHGIDRTVIGVSFDGLGWGDDGQVWGGEFMLCDLGSYNRAGHIAYVPMPGGDAATKRPPRMAYAYLREAFGEDAGKITGEILPGLSSRATATIDRMIEKSLHTPMTSSAGRLFDAASALLGICDANTYEGQAPMELEGISADGEEGFYEAAIEDRDEQPFVVRAADVIRGLVKDIQSGTARETCAARFHNAVAAFIAAGCERVRDREGITEVALSGGVFANVLLLERAVHLLEQKGFSVLLNTTVPAGDGGVSLGQAAIAAAHLAMEQ